jgi:hypothetical protein
LQEENMKALAVVFCLAPALALGQSLGDAAQREKERRKKADATASPSPVFTNDNLAAHKGQLANDPNASPPPPDRPLRAPSDSKQKETEWRQRASAARARLERAKQRYAAAQNRVVVPHRGMVPLQNAQQQTDTAKAEVETAQRALDDLLESARRQNIPAGWVQ